MIVSTFAALLAILYVYLSIAVVKLRKAKAISLGDGNDPHLIAAIRAHANFIEYVPLSILLLFLAEYQGLASHYCYLLGLTLLCGRLCHCFALKENSLRLRVVGMVLTFSTILAASFVLLITRG